MSGETPGEHWLDLLAAPRTRRQVLTAALAGAAVTLPFTRSARAAIRRGPHDCQKGCFVASHIRFDRQTNACQDVGIANLVQAGVLLFALPGGLAVASVAPGLALMERGSCLDRALIAEKAMQFDCLKDDCPGFDPEGPDGPCGDSCKLVGGKCCPDPESAIGYTCYSQCAD
jgi:hypothetical protein